MRLRQAAELPQRQSRLAVQVGDRGFLLNLDDVSEVSPVGSVTPVPLTAKAILGEGGSPTPDGRVLDTLERIAANAVRAAFLPPAERDAIVRRIAKGSSK